MSLPQLFTMSLQRHRHDPFTSLVHSIILGFLLLLLCFSSHVVVDATVSIIDSGVTYESRPDHKIGQRLWKGYEYMGRMQHIIENPTLCPPQDGGFETDKKYKITPPSDGLPGTYIL